MRPNNSKKLISFLALSLSLLAVVFAAGCNLSFNANETAELVINEVVSSNSLSLIDPIIGSPDWIEIHNFSNRDIDLEGYHVTDNIKDIEKYTFPKAIVPAGGYILVYATGNGEQIDGLYCTDFNLAKSGETVYLIDPFYKIVSEVELPALSADVSYARHSDGTFGFCGAPTPGEANDDADIVESGEHLTYAAKGGALIISEAVPYNTSGLSTASGEYYGWVELYNTTGEPISLSAYRLSDNEYNYGKWTLPDITLAGGERAIVFLSGKDSSVNGEMHASFKLASDELGVYLADSQGALCSYLSWDAGMPENLAVVHTEEGNDNRYTAYSTPAAPNSDVTFSSLELTPMSSENAVRLNEVLRRNAYSAIDADGDRYEWAELHNTTSSPVSLRGYCLSDDAGNPGKWMLPDMELPADGYVIVFLSGKNRTDPAGELHASFSLASGEPVLLTNLNGMTCDLIEIDYDIGKNVSIGLNSSGEYAYFAQPTPGQENYTSSFASSDLVPLVNTNGVYISEVSSVGAPKSGFIDWVELYNGGSHSVDLQGWYLSDDPNEPYKWQFPGTRIGAGEYLVVYCTTSKESGKSVVTNFNISASGETIILSDEDKNYIDAFESGVLEPGKSSGRLHGDSSGQRVFFTSVTRGEENAASTRTGYAAQPHFSDNSLYHSSSFELTMTCSTPGATIYYTTSGSEPTSSSHVYSGPITISKNTPVRAIAVAAGCLNSVETAHTYLFVEKHTLPVVCLSMDPDTFAQVYAVTDRWKKIERAGYAEYFEADGTLGISFPTGMRVNGAGTLKWRQKSLALRIRGGYGQNQVTYPFFRDFDIKTFTGLVLRASGQDASLARIRDAYFNRIMNGMNVDNVQTRLTVVYINGRYYGLYELQEDQNADYLASHYGVNVEDNVDFIRRNVTALEGDNVEIKRVRAYALSRDLNNESTYAQFMEWVDEDYWIDYLCARSFIGDSDMFNQKYWRTRDYSVKWRPLLYDMDLALHSSVTRDVLHKYFTYEGVPSADGSLTNMDIWVGLYKNKQWRQKFVERYVYLLYNQLNAETVTSILDEMAAEMEPEMERHIDRWNSPSSVRAWKNAISDLRDMMEKRPEIALDQIRDTFSVSDEQWNEYVERAKAAAAAG